MWTPRNNYNPLLTEREGRTTSLCSGCTATTEGQYSPVRPEQARLVSCLLYDALFQIVKCNGTLLLIVKMQQKQLLILKLEKGFLVDQTIFSWLQNMDQVVDEVKL